MLKHQLPLSVLFFLSIFFCYGQIGQTKFDVIKNRGNNFEIESMPEYNEQWIKYTYGNFVEDFQFQKNSKGEYVCILWLITTQDRSILEKKIDNFLTQYKLVKMTKSIWTDENKMLKFETTQQWGTDDYHITITRWNGE